MLHLHIFPILTFLLLSSSAANNHRFRRLLHQPFFPLEQTPVTSQPPSSAPSPQPQQPKYPFSSPSPPAPPTQSPFFPEVSYTPPPPPPSSPAAFGTFPANVSSLVLPSPSHSSHKTTKLVSLIALVSFFSILVCFSLFLLLRRHRRRRRHQHDDQSLKTDSLRLFPPNTPSSDTIPSTAITANATKKSPPPRRTPSSTSSEFLYLGTLASSRDPDRLQNDGNAPLAIGPTNYQTLGSPELLPLPPLPPQPSGKKFSNTLHPQRDDDDEEEDDGEEFFSPRGSTANNATPNRTGSSHPHSNNKNGNTFNKTGILNSFDCSNSSLYSISPDNTPSAFLNSRSPRSLQTKSPDSSVVFPAPLPRFIPPPARQPRAFSALSPSSTEDGGTQDCSPRSSDFSGVERTPPSQPPLAPPAAAPRNGPSELVGPSRKVVMVEKGSLGNPESKNEEILKPLHWDKVRAGSDSAMVWDQLKSSSFHLNEERIETPFTVNYSNVNVKEGLRRHVISETSQEIFVLDPKKSQNIAILLRALNVTNGEVCLALLEGNVNALGTEILESLLRMAPSKEEECKLMEFKDSQSPLKLGPAEAFLKAVLNVPFAFRRIDAMLFVAKFESKIEYLNRSLDTLESACKELKSSRMFLKLLETVLETGNRMNTGTHRGGAPAFKLDTLLKHADVKGADGKTTILHFVVQEIIKADGPRARSSGPNQSPDPEESQQSTLQDNVEFKKLGLQVVSGLSGELMNVKMAAAMDSDVLTNDLAMLVVGIGKIHEVLKLGHSKFLDKMSEFLKKAEGDIRNIKAREGMAFSMVKNLTEYFHGDSGMEVAHPLRLFTVVRDFLSVLDRVCKEVGKKHELTMMNSGQQAGTAGNASLFGSVFQGQQSSSSDDESSSSF